MVVDKQTLKDLEIFKASEDGLSIFDLLDKTVTSGGKYILEQKFKKPLASIGQIMQVQDAIAYLSENNDNWMLPFSDSIIKSLEN
jgi:DNA mismatch repair ATPase MutS